MDRAERHDRLLALYHRHWRCRRVLWWGFHVVGWLLIAAMVAAFAGAVWYNYIIHHG